MCFVAVELFILKSAQKSQFCMGKSERQVGLSVS